MITKDSLPAPLEGLIWQVDSETEEVFHRNWHWKTGERFVPVLVTVFGDWILVDRGTGQCAVLDLVEGDLRSTGLALRDFLETLAASPESRDDYLLEGLVASMRGRGQVALQGHVYEFKVHPILGAPFDPANVVTESLPLNQAKLAALFRAIGS